MLRITDLHKHFQKTVALDGVTMTVPDGCIYGLVGSNGSGKSTLLRLIAGVLRASKGEILLDDAPVYENAAAKRQMMLVPDEPFFQPNTTLRRTEAFYRAVYPSFDSARFAELCSLFRLSTDTSLDGFSRGMRRLAATALALAVRPRLLLLDETTDGLDPVMRHIVKGVIADDVMERGAAALIVSHSLRELEGMCDQLALLHEGRLVLDRDVLDLKRASYKVQIAFDRPFTRELFAGLSVVHYEQQSSVATLILEGDREVIDLSLRAMEPLLLEVLPLTLEEIFLYELRSLDYDYTAFLGGDDA